MHGVAGTVFRIINKRKFNMVSCRIGLEYKYDFSAPKFRTAFAFLERKDLMDLPLGWIELENGVRASVQSYTSINGDEGFYETHEKFFDIQYVVKGKEYIGVTVRDGLSVKTPYDESGDITFYNDPERKESMVYLEDGDYIILAPEDAHKPRLAAGEKMEIRKIVVKVPV